MEIIKVGILGLAGVLIAIQFKSTKPEYSLYLGAAICLIIFPYSLDGLFTLMGYVKTLENYLGEKGGYLGFLFKAVGITYVCEFCASICKDAGHRAIAGQIEIFGKISVLLMGMPVLAAVIENISAIAN